MLAGGWRPDDPDDLGGEAAEIDEDARGILRMAVEPGAEPAACVPVERTLTIATADYPVGLVLSPAEPVAVRIRFTDDFGVGRRILRVDGPVLIRYPDDVTGELRVSPVGPFTALEVCMPEGDG
jgi:hypothetical protein